jgi:hypothetical protein
LILRMTGRRVDPQDEGTRVAPQDDRAGVLLLRMTGREMQNGE